MSLSNIMKQPAKKKLIPCMYIKTDGLHWKAQPKPTRPLLTGQPMSTSVVTEDPSSGEETTVPLITVDSLTPTLPVVVVEHT